MEIFVRNLPDQASEKQISIFFEKVLNTLSIKTYHCQKLKSRGLATITILDTFKGRQFLSAYGQTSSNARGSAPILQKLQFMGRSVNCSKSNKEPDQYLLLTLKKEESDRYVASQSRKPKIVPPKVNGAHQKMDDQRAFDISKLMCGQWTYSGNDLVFANRYEERRQGRLFFADRMLFIKLKLGTEESFAHQIEIPYDSIQSFTIGPKSKPSLTFSLSEAPKFYGPPSTELADTGSDLVTLMQQIGIQPKKSTYTRQRTTALSGTHKTVVPSCLCYRFVLSQANDIDAVRALKNTPGVPASISWNTSIIIPSPFVDQMTRLDTLLAGHTLSKVPFEVKFQMQKLAQNGYLEPLKVLELLSFVYRHLESSRKVASLAQAVRNLAGYLPFAGPETEASELTVQTLSEYLVKSQESILCGDTYSVDPAEQHDHLALVHKAMATPTGIYLFGPEPETKNRVLRKYSAFADYFLSVSFCDEDGQSLYLNRHTSGYEIYHRRFKKILEGVINIAGRGYEFLGFSHSSLRAQTCWFMAPFTLDGSLIYARSVIKDLGNFSSIRSPAKCAARIGQAFSQTLTAVKIPPEAFSIMKDVERNGRTFSDGVGTCSLAVLQETWKAYSQARGLKPTVLQIRFQGAKGVIALDSRLEGTALRLRPSMIKFEGTNAADIEICGSALRTLPMILNRQTIKIMEDLYVPGDSFLRLQADAVEKLRMTTLSAINAASFFERNFIGKAARLPWLIRKMWDLGFSFTNDDFLRDTLELAVLVQLREIKYRARIRVEKGVTVYGIMDETNYLQEGEVYCSVVMEEVGRIITGGVVVTRSPALHPGDIQCVRAVDVPTDSPLRALHNVLVFSSYGERDLPSQLSGGDLDGDLYNVIYDETLYPKRIAEPADYSRPEPIDIGRTVERSDMTDFFIKFMENDNLGQIATLHQILADQSEMGTFDPVCVSLAGMHSTAVDFSKTGIPVDFKKLPRYPKWRPDFQAPGPRVVIEKEIDLLDEEPPSPNDENLEFEEVASYGPQKHRYYESSKILGRLYRDIDEHQVFGRIKTQSKALGGQAHQTNSLAKAVWKYVSDKTALIQWHHHLEFATNVKESYEESLVDTMIQYSNHPLKPVSEIEVFAGSILGKSGSQSKRQREFSISMKEKHERDVTYIKHWITKGEEGNSGAEALERSIACLHVACNTARVTRRVGELKSFVWIAASVCLSQVEKLLGAEVLS